MKKASSKHDDVQPLPPKGSSIATAFLKLARTSAASSCAYSADTSPTTSSKLFQNQHLYSSSHSVSVGVIDKQRYCSNTAHSKQRKYCSSVHHTAGA
jgi:hypothetical protein